jgi:hypothetical protein
MLIKMPQSMLVFDLTMKRLKRFASLTQHVRRQSHTPSRDAARSVGAGDPKWIASDASRAVVVNSHGFSQ